MFIDTEELLIVYLSRIHQDATVSAELGNTPACPAILVTRLPGATDDHITEHATASVHVFHTSRDAARAYARRVHATVLSLTPKVPVQLGNSVVRVESVTTIQGPSWVTYEDENLVRYVARYEVTSRITSQPLD